MKEKINEIWGIVKRSIIGKLTPEERGNLIDNLQTNRQRAELIAHLFNTGDHWSPQDNLVIQGIQPLESVSDRFLIHIHRIFKNDQRRKINYERKT